MNSDDYQPPADWLALVEEIGAELDGTYARLGAVLDGQAPADEWADLTARIKALGKTHEALAQEGHALYTAWLLGEGDRT